MHIDDKVLFEILWRKNPHMSDAQVAACARKYHQRLKELDDLMMTWDAYKMRALVSSVDLLIKELRSIMHDKEAFHLGSAIGGGLGVLVGLFSITNPVGRFLLLGGGFLMSAAFGIGAVDKSEEKNRKLRQIQRVIEDDRIDFCEMAKAIRNLDDVSLSYLKCSLFSEENQQFLKSAASYEITNKKYSCSEKNNHEVLMQIFFKKIATAESLNKIHKLIIKCKAISTAATMNPLLVVAVQTLLLVKEINDNESTMEQLVKDVAAIRKECEILEQIM